MIPHWRQFTHNNHLSACSLLIIHRHFVSIYYYLRGEGIDFPETDEYDTPKKPSQPLTTNPDAVSSQQEADDIAKGFYNNITFTFKRCFSAIEASLKEEQEKNKRKGASSLYPSMQDEVKQSAASSTATSSKISGFIITRSQ